jgi:hypothetical protein
MNKKPKIFRIFFNDFNLDDDLSNYDIVYPNAKETLYEYSFTDLSTTMVKDFDESVFEGLNEEIIKKIEDNPDIQGVYMGYDVEAFLIIATFQNLSKVSLKGYFQNLNKTTTIKLPDLESFYQLHHKVYQKMLETNPIKYSYFDLFADDWDRDLPKFPFYMKSALGDGGTHNYIIRDRKQLNDVVDILRREIPKKDGIYLYFAKKYLDLKKFPLADKHIILCEELVENFKSFNIDGFVDDLGNITTLLSSDQLIRNEVVIGYRFPSQLSGDIINKAKNMGTDLLKKSGLKNSFFNIDYFLLKNGDIKITEINPRSYVYGNDNYHHYGIRYTDMAINISMGKKISLPHFKNPHMFSTQLHIRTKESGKVREIFHIENSREISKKIHAINYIEGVGGVGLDHIVVDDYHKNGQNRNGCLFYVIFFTSSTIEESEKKILEYQKLLLIKDNYFKSQIDNV